MAGFTAAITNYSITNCGGPAGTPALDRLYYTPTGTFAIFNYNSSIYTTTFGSQWINNRAFMNENYAFASNNLYIQNWPTPPIIFCGIQGQYYCAL